MVYKPRKTVNGHKRNDRATRRRKARDARKRRAAARPVRSNIKRYVAEQFGKTHPDNRYYKTFSKALKPTNKLVDTPRYYPFGATFQRDFLRMEFQRMKEVVTQTPANAAIIGGHSTDHVTNMNKAIGNHNHWKSLLGRGIHMKHSSVYGTITLNENIPLKMQSILKYGNLKLHMFVLEDKAVTKTEFLNWYKDFLQTSATSQGTVDGAEKFKPGPITTDANSKLISEYGRYITDSDGDISHDHYDTDLIQVPYVSGSQYASSNTDGTGKHFVCGEVTAADARPKSGFDEFLIDWSKFYKIDNDTNPHSSLFYNEVKCTTEWDGTRANSLLPVNKSRFIVHEHKTWSFKPKSNGCVDTVIPFEYSFPEHYMHYDKELLDMPFVWNEDTSDTNKDDRGLHFERLYPRKQPFIVFVYTCDNPQMIEGPTAYHDIHYNNPSGAVRPVTAYAKENEMTNIEDGNASDDDGPTAMKTDIGVGISNVAKEQKDGDLRVKRTRTDATAAIHDSNWLNMEFISSETTTVSRGNVFSIDMHFKCTYENKLATSVVPTINKGRPIIHKRESAPKKRTLAKRPRGPAREMESRKYRQTNLKDIYKVRRNAGPARDIQVRNNAQARAEAIQRGKEMRIAMRRQEAKQKLLDVFALHGHTTASYNKAVESIFSKSTDKNVWMENMGMGAIAPFVGAGPIHSGIGNMLYTFLTPEVRKYISEVLYNEDQPNTHAAIKQAARTMLNYYIEKHSP